VDNKLLKVDMATVRHLDTVSWETGKILGH